MLLYLVASATCCLPLPRARSERLGEVRKVAGSRCRTKCPLEIYMGRMATERATSSRSGQTLLELQRTSCDARRDHLQRGSDSGSTVTWG